MSQTVVVLSIVFLTLVFLVVFLVFVGIVSRKLTDFFTLLPDGEEGNNGQDPEHLLLIHSAKNNSGVGPLDDDMDGYDYGVQV